MYRRPVGGLIAMAVLAGCASGTGSDAGEQPDNGPDAATVATAPPCEELPGEPVAAGAETLPPLTFDCLGPGPDVSLDRLTGRPTLVNLWATWCLPCREEMPVLQEAFVRYGQQVRFLGVDVQDRPEGASSFVSDLGIDYPHVVDPDGELLAALGVRGLPVTLAVDREGRIVNRVVGQLDAQRLEELIDTLLA